MAGEQKDSAQALAGYIEGFRERAQAAARAAAEHRRAVRQCLPKVVRCLVDEYGATRIVLFGSFARDEATSESDVDLLVDGIAAERFFEAQAAVDRILHPTAVDLVPRESARPLVLERAESEGELLHG